MPTGSKPHTAYSEQKEHTALIQRGLDAAKHSLGDVDAAAALKSLERALQPIEVHVMGCHREDVDLVEESKCMQIQAAVETPWTPAA